MFDLYSTSLSTVKLSTSAIVTYDAQTVVDNYWFPRNNRASYIKCEYCKSNNVFLYDTLDCRNCGAPLDVTRSFIA